MIIIEPNSHCAPLLSFPILNTFPNHWFQLLFHTFIYVLAYHHGESLLIWATQCIQLFISFLILCQLIFERLEILFIIFLVLFLNRRCTSMIIGRKTNHLVGIFRLTFIRICWSSLWVLNNDSRSPTFDIEPSKIQSHRNFGLCECKRICSVRDGQVQLIHTQLTKWELYLILSWFVEDFGCIVEVFEQRVLSFYGAWVESVIVNLWLSAIFISNHLIARFFEVIVVLSWNVATNGNCWIPIANISHFHSLMVANEWFIFHQISDHFGHGFKRRAYLLG